MRINQMNKEDFQQLLETVRVGGGNRAIMLSDQLSKEQAKMLEEEFNNYNESLRVMASNASRLQSLQDKVILGEQLTDEEKKEYISIREGL